MHFETNLLLWRQAYNITKIARQLFVNLIVNITYFILDILMPSLLFLVAMCVADFALEVLGSRLEVQRESSIVPRLLLVMDRYEQAINSILSLQFPFTAYFRNEADGSKNSNNTMQPLEAFSETKDFSETKEFSMLNPRDMKNTMKALERATRDLKNNIMELI